MTTAPLSRWILLVTGKDETQDVVRLMLDGLPDQCGSYPNVRRYMNAALVRLSSVERSVKELEQCLQSTNEPLLILIDALVRRSGHETTPGDGTGAMDILKWMESRGCKTPVLVMSAVSLERLDHEVLLRRTVGQWDMGPEPSVFARTLASLDIEPSGPQRITVEVGHKSARYRIDQGERQHTFDRPYTNVSTFNALLKGAAILSPFEPSTRELRLDWQSHLGNYGRTLFQLLLHDGLGQRVDDIMGEVAASNGSADVDVRFQIDVNDSKLFALPFEIANPDALAESFLCARVPMARRVSMVSGGLTGSPAPVAPEDPNRELRVLFLNADVGGTVNIVHGRTGERKQHTLDHLQNIADEQALLKALAAKRGSRLKRTTVISGSRMRGQTLVDHVRDTLRGGGHDILHFSGHSITLSDDGGTFLIFPGKRGEAMAVSVGEIADWVREGGCRLVVLSSCKGSSMRTAIETMRAGAAAVLGFRWDVDDDLCVEYFRSFYKAYLVERKSVSAAYRHACSSFQRGAQGGRPLWASAVAVVRD